MMQIDQSGNMTLEDAGETSKACRADFASSCAAGLGRACCTNVKDSGDADSDWTALPVTPDLKAMMAFASRQTSPLRRTLLVGIGNSEVAGDLLRKHSSQVDGITYSLAEKEYAEEQHGSYIKSGDYRVIVGNKYNPATWKELRNDYDLILDNNLASYACCPSFYREMVKDFVSRLAPGGKLLTEKMGMDYTLDGVGYALSPDELTELANSMASNRPNQPSEEETSSFAVGTEGQEASVTHIFSERVASEGCPEMGCHVFALTR